MALTRQQKETQLKALAESMKSASSIVFAHYIGLSVSDITKLRSNLRKENAEMKVGKKTLIRLAAKQASLPEIADNLLPGPVACIFSKNEPTSGPGITYAFSKTHPQVKLIGGIFSGQLLSEADALSLAQIPSKQQLLATFMSMCRSPLVSFASACSSPLSGFARALSEVAKKKAVSAPAAATPAA
jgi:large subunit ribosomal protein L10